MGTSGTIRANLRGPSPRQALDTSRDVGLSHISWADSLCHKIVAWSTGCCTDPAGRTRCGTVTHPVSSGIRLPGTAVSHQNARVKTTAAQSSRQHHVVVGELTAEHVADRVHDVAERREVGRPLQPGRADGHRQQDPDEQHDRHQYDERHSLLRHRRLDRGVGAASSSVGLNCRSSVPASTRACARAPCRTRRRPRSRHRGPRSGPPSVPCDLSPVRAGAVAARQGGERRRRGRSSRNETKLTV